LKFRRPPQFWRYTSLLQKCAKSVDAFISPSFFTRGMHQQRGFAPGMTVLPHFVPEVNGRARDAMPAQRRPYFLYVGRLEKIKGVESLLAAFREYLQADLLIAGTGTMEMELRRQAHGMSNVSFLGALPQKTLADFYRNAVAVLVPSAGYEVLGLIVLEALLHRTPVIAHDLGALTEVIEQSQGGLLYRDQKELLGAMERMQNDAELRRRMGERGYRAYTERWTEEAHVGAYFDLLDETAQSKLGYIPWEQPTRSSLQFSSAIAVGAGAI
jgi:glycosyltransferase involved in cell wall biosynthesis